MSEKTERSIKDQDNAEQLELLWEYTEEELARRKRLAELQLLNILELSKHKRQAD